MNGNLERELWKNVIDLDGRAAGRPRFLVPIVGILVGLMIASIATYLSS